MQDQKHPAFSLSWDDVRLFLSLCRSRTLAVAAESLSIDASTVSRRLTIMEGALQATLFDRTREGITPTAAAEDLMPVAEEIEEAMLRFATAADVLEREVSGGVRLTCPPDVAEVLVAPILRELFQKHPALRVALDAGEAVLDLSRRESDIALRIVRPTRGDLIVTKLRAARWMVVASPKLARALGTLRSWDDAPWIGWGARLSHIGPAQWLTKHARGVEPLVRSDSMVVQLAMAKQGIGIALVPEPSADYYGLVPVKLSAALRGAASEWPSDELFLVTHRALRNVPRVRAVWEHLVERLSERK